MKHKLRMIWRILRDRQVVVITEDHGRMYYAWELHIIGNKFDKENKI